MEKRDGKVIRCSGPAIFGGHFDLEKAGIPGQGLRCSLVNGALFATNATAEGTSILTNGTSVWVSAGGIYTNYTITAWPSDYPGGGCSDSVSLNVFRVQLEPITSRPDTLPLYNPCGIQLNSSATFEIMVEAAASIPDASIAWKKESGSGGVAEGTGRLAQIQGVTPGDVTMKVEIAGVTNGNVPTIKLKVLDKKTIPVSAYIVAKNDGSDPVTDTQHIAGVIATVNLIYKQTAMEFVLANVGIVSNTDYKVIDTKAKLDGLCNTTSGTGGVELYFVESLAGDYEEYGGVNAKNSAGASIGSVVRANAQPFVAAHEFGHACDLKDIYTEKNFDEVQGYVSYDRLPDDWGSGHYVEYLEQQTLIRRLLMYGYGYPGYEDTDLPLGKVDGLHGIKDAMGNYVYEFGMVKVGLNDMNRQPQDK